MILDFTCTATRRPGIFRDCLASFAINLRGVEFAGSTLYLNIDPLPIEGDGGAVALVAREFFGRVIANQPDHASFPAAVKWCWSQPTGDRFFSIEDDWILEQPVDIAEMLDLLACDPALSLVNLRAYPHNDDRLCLAPGLWRTAHAKAIAGSLRGDVNPERQLRAVSPSNPHGGLHVGYRGRQWPEKRVIRDIGRLWMETNGLKRARGINFTEWARV